MKHVTFEGKMHNRPDVIIERLFDVIQQQMKAGRCGLTHSAKGRKRKRKVSDDEEKWSKKNIRGKRRSKYLSIIDKIRSKTSSNKNTKDKGKRKVSEKER